MVFYAQALENQGKNNVNLHTRLVLHRIAKLETYAS